MSNTAITILELFQNQNPEIKIRKTNFNQGLTTVEASKKDERIANSSATLWSTPIILTESGEYYRLAYEGEKVSTIFNSDFLVWEKMKNEKNTAETIITITAYTSFQW